MPNDPIKEEGFQLKHTPFAIAVTCRYFRELNGDGSMDGLAFIIDEELHKYAHTLEDALMKSPDNFRLFASFVASKQPS